MEYSLKSIKSKLTSVYSLLSWKMEPIGTTYNFTGLNNIRTALKFLSELNLFEEAVKELQTSVFFTVSSDMMSISPQEASRLNNTLNNLKDAILNLKSVLDKTIPDENQNSVNIKLPPVNDFNDLSVISRDLHISLTQVLYNEEINGETKITSVENGSIWINVLVGSGIALGVLASLAWAAAVISKKIRESKLLDQQIRSLKVKNDSLEDISNAQKESLALLVQAEAEHINTEQFKENVPENVERIKNSIKLLAELIEKGAEIHPAIVAPENVSNLFPDMRNLIGIESKIKKIAS